MRYCLLSLLLLACASLHAQPAQPGHNSHRKYDGRDDRHIATFTPFCGVVAYDNFNPGAGIDYEFILNKELGIGLHIPVIIGYSGPEQQDFGNRYYRHTSIYTAPGIRFHTGKGNSDIDFSTGPSVLIGNIHFSPLDDYYNPQPVRDPYNYSMLGLVADNTLNFYRNHFVFGFDIRVGTMIDTHEDTRFFLHFGMHFGGKF